jgi:hypothetical protein
MEILIFHDFGIEEHLSISPVTWVLLWMILRHVREAPKKEQDRSGEDH